MVDRQGPNLKFVPQNSRARKFKIDSAKPPHQKMTKKWKIKATRETLNEVRERRNSDTPSLEACLHSWSLLDDEEVDSEVEAITRRQRSQSTSSRLESFPRLAEVSGRLSPRTIEGRQSPRNRAAPYTRPRRQSLPSVLLPKPTEKTKPRKISADEPLTARKLPSIQMLLEEEGLEQTSFNNVNLSKVSSVIQNGSNPELELYSSPKMGSHPVSPNSSSPLIEDLASKFHNFKQIKPQPVDEGTFMPKDIPFSQA